MSAFSGDPWLLVALGCVMIATGFHLGFSTLLWRARFKGIWPVGPAQRKPEVVQAKVLCGLCLMWFGLLPMFVGLERLHINFGALDTAPAAAAYFMIFGGFYVMQRYYHARPRRLWMFVTGAVVILFAFSQWMWPLPDEWAKVPFVAGGILMTLASIDVGRLVGRRRATHGTKGYSRQL